MLGTFALLLLVFLQVARGIEIDVDNVGTFPYGMPAGSWKNYADA
jgi:hypothetical protein